MKMLQLGMLALAVATLAGCVTRERTVVERPVVHERTVIAPAQLPVGVMTVRSWTCQPTCQHRKASRLHTLPCTRQIMFSI